MVGTTKQPKRLLGRNVAGLLCVNLEICSAAFGPIREQRQERSMNTFMFLTFVLVFLLGIVTGTWLNAMTVRSLKPDQFVGARRKS